MGDAVAEDVAGDPRADTTSTAAVKSNVVTFM
jgi:hypothetical protein